MEVVDVAWGEDGFGDVEPFVGAACAFFDLSDRGEVFVEFVAVFASELLVHAMGVICDGVEDAASAAESAADGLFAIAFDAEQHVEDLLGIPFGGELDAVAGPCEGGPFDGHFERLESGGDALDFGDELVGRDGVAEGPSVAWDVGSGEPDFFAVMMFTDDHRMMESADGGDVVAMFFERLQGGGELVVGAGFLDLPSQCVDAVWDVEEDAAFGFGGGWDGGHAVEQGECDGCACASEEGSTGDLPFIEVDVHGGSVGWGLLEESGG